jgi:hypothetical protein
MYSAHPRIGIMALVLAVMVCDLAFGLGRAFAEPPPPEPVLYPISEGVVFERHVVGAAKDADVARSSGERLIYSNTLGKFAAALPANQLLADDIATTAPNGCKLRRYEFPVVGKVDPAGIGGPYTVNFALYSTCPGASPPETAAPISGTLAQVAFPDDAPRLISFTLPGMGVTIPNNVWFGVRFSRNNAGVVVGGVAGTGVSCDRLDFPGVACNANFGGFPANPHGSFNLQMFGEENCAEVFVGYKNDRPSGPVFNPGNNQWLLDDITLAVPGCQMISYEVAVRGIGFYQFEMRPNCEDDGIPGTYKLTSVFFNELHVSRFAFDPPIAVPEHFWFATRVLDGAGSIITTGTQAGIGETADVYAVSPPGPFQQCSTIDVPEVHAGVNLTITCAGQLPAGACCDMGFTDQNGDAVCREVPQMNCPWPPRFSPLQPAWVAGAACHPDPFGIHPCGVAACCYGDQQGDECSNLTQTQCDQAGNLTRPRQWQRGRYCNEFGQQCVHPDCLGRTGDYTLPRCRPQAGVCNLTSRTCSAGYIGHGCNRNADCDCIGGQCEVGSTCCDSCPPVGCEDAECCTRVCNYAAFGLYCCTTEWDTECASLAQELCRCPVNAETDADGDGVGLPCDLCPYTRPGVKVDENGCAIRTRLPIDRTQPE